MGLAVRRRSRPCIKDEYVVACDACPAAAGRIERTLIVADPSHRITKVGRGPEE
jgi:hypothetical protein